MVIETTVVEGQTTLWLESVVENCVTWVNNLLGTTLTVVDSFPEYLGRFNEALFIYSFLLLETVSSFVAAGFSEFQFKLLQVFLVILTTHIIAIIIAWKIYGQKIFERFYKQGASLQLNEQLKSGVSELKLPKDHTPRW